MEGRTVKRGFLRLREKRPIGSPPTKQERQRRRRAKILAGVRLKQEKLNDVVGG